MSNLTPTKRGINCPICDDSTGKCRITDNNLYLCMTSPDGLIQISGYKFVNSTKNGDWGIYAEDNEQSYTNDFKHVYKAQRVEREATEKAKHQRSLTLVERNQEYHKLLDQLTLNSRDRHDLERRGLNAEQIERGLFRSVGKWHPLANAVNAGLAGTLSNGTKLNIGADGYLVPIPNIDGLIVGSQYRIANPTDGGKYLWLTSRTKNNPDGNQPNLPNGEIPIGVYRPQNLTRQGVVGLDEGYLKPSIGCEKVEHICLGAAGGNFASSPEQFKQALENIEQEQGVKPYLLLYPDAGAIQNHHVMETYSRIYKMARKLDYELKIAWWGQTSKSKHQDIDELTTINGIKEIPWFQFLGLQHKALKDEDLTISQRYLLDLDIPDSAKLICLRSPKGTNKTGYLAKYVDANRFSKRFLVICHRSQLTQQLGHRLGLRTHYELETARDGQREAIAWEIGNFGMVTTWDSLHKIDPDNWQNVEIILDEAEQSIWHLLNSSTDIESHRIDTIAMFSQLVQECNRTWLLDADLTNTALDFVSGLTSRQDFDPYIVLNNYVFEEPWQITIYSGNTPTGIHKKLFGYLGNNKKCLLHLDSQNHKSKYSGVNIEQMVNEKYPHLKILLIDSHTIQNPDHPAYKILTDENISDRLSGYDLVIASPTIETGVSIEGKGLFDAVFGIFQGAVTADGARQALARYREPVERHIWARRYSPTSGNPDWKQALIRQAKAMKAHIKGLQDADLAHIETNPSQAALTTWAKMQARVKSDALRFKDAIIDGLKADGHIVNESDELDKDEHKQILEEVTINRDESYSAKCDSISGQALIDDDAAEKIAAKRSQTDTDKEQLSKYNLNKLYGVNVSSELVRLDDNGLYKKLRLFYFLTNGRQHLKSRDKAKLSSLLNAKKQVWQPTANKKLIHGQVDLLDKLEVAKVLMQPNKEYRGSDADLIKFRKKVVKHRYEIKTLFGIDINPVASAIAIANQLLTTMGQKLNLICRDKLKNGKAGQRVYIFSPISETNIRHEILQNWLKVDAQKSAQKMAEIVTQQVLEPDPPTVIIYSKTDSGSNLSGSNPEIESTSPVLNEIETGSAEPKINAMVTLLDGVTGFIHQIEIGGWYLIGRLSDISQGFGRWVQLHDIAAISYV